MKSIKKKRPKRIPRRIPRPGRAGTSSKMFSIKFTGGDLDGRVGYYPIPKTGKNRPIINKSFWVFGIPWTEHCRYYVAKEVKRPKEGDQIEYVFETNKEGFPSTIQYGQGSFLGKQTMEFNICKT
jgi:hypothetical protein